MPDINTNIQPQQKTKGLWLSTILLSILNLMTFGALYSVVVLRVYYIELPAWFDILVFILPAIFVVGTVWILSLLLRRRVSKGASSLPFEIFCLFFSFGLLNLFLTSYSAGPSSRAFGFTHLAGAIVVWLIYASVFKFVSKKRTIILALIGAVFLGLNLFGLKILNNFKSTVENRQIQEVVNNLGAPPLILATAEEKAKADQLGMVYVPEGEYLSGIPSSNKKPLITITLRSFYIDRLEVTNTKFAEFIKQNPKWQKGNTEPSFTTGRYLKQFMGVESPKEMANHPVIWVSWFSAKAYCEANDKRLPTAAEWEKAARGTDGRIYPWGNNFDGSRANFCDKNCPLYFRDNRFDDGYAGLAPVGLYPKGTSPYGVLDMSGNVAEWVGDWYDPSGAFDAKEARRDPRGPLSGSRKLVRGSTFQSSEADAGTAIYLFGAESPDKSLSEVGFRCAADVK